MKNFLFWAVIVVMSPLNAATLIFDDGFESGDLRNYKPHLMNDPNITFNVVNSTVASGRYSGKLDLPFVSVQADSYRAETQLANNLHQFYFGKEYWFSFNFRYEDWAKDISAETAPFQVHLRPGSWDAACSTGSHGGASPVYMIVENDIVEFNTYGNRTMWSAPIQKQKWMTVTVHFKPSYDTDGLIEGWIDGVKIGSVSGANQMKYDKCGNLMKSPYFNIGIYKWDWRAGRPATQSSRRTLLVDDLKIAEGADGYNLVTSSSGVNQDITAPTISNVQATAITSNSATITWTTDENSNSVVNYGLTNAYGSNYSNTELLTSHSVNLTNLSPNTTYHYQVTSTDANGNTASSADFEFTTSAVIVVTELLNDSFNRSNSTKIGNDWVETEENNAFISLISQSLYFADTTDKTNRPMASRSFQKVSDGVLEWNFDFNWTRIGSEKDYKLFMQIGDSTQMLTTDQNAGVAVNLVWTPIGVVHQMLGVIKSGEITSVNLLKGLNKIKVIANFNTKTYNIEINDILVKSDIVFDNDVPIDTVRFFTDGLNEVNFSGRSFDNVLIKNIL